MNAIQQNRGLFFFEAILFIILGIIGITLPMITTLATELFLGWLLIVGGIFQFIRTFSNRDQGFWPFLIGSIVSIIVGVLLLIYPLTGVLTLTILLSAFFLLDGISRIATSFQYRKTAKWGWILFNGLVSLILAFIIWMGWPGTAAWVLGTLVGVYFLVYGSTLLFLIFQDKPVA